MPMKHLPNILSSLRIVGTVVLLLSDVSSILFGVLYIVCRGRHLLRSMLCLEAPADTRTATMAMVVGRSNRRD